MSMEKKDSELRKLADDLEISMDTAKRFYNMAEEYRKPNRGRYGGAWYGGP